MGGYTRHKIFRGRVCRRLPPWEIIMSKRAAESKSEGSSKEQRSFGTDLEKLVAQASADFENWGLGANPYSPMIEFADRWNLPSLRKSAHLPTTYNIIKCYAGGIEVVKLSGAAEDKPTWYSHFRSPMSFYRVGSTGNFGEWNKIENDEVIAHLFPTLAQDAKVHVSMYDSTQPTIVTEFIDEDEKVHKTLHNAVYFYIIQDMVKHWPRVSAEFLQCVTKSDYEFNIMFGHAVFPEMLLQSAKEKNYDDDALYNFTCFLDHAPQALTVKDPEGMTTIMRLCADRHPLQFLQLVISRQIFKPHEVEMAFLLSCMLRRDDVIRFFIETINYFGDKDKAYFQDEAMVEAAGQFLSVGQKNPIMLYCTWVEGYSQESDSSRDDINIWTFELLTETFPEMMEDDHKVNEDNNEPFIYRILDLYIDEDTRAMQSVILQMVVIKNPKILRCPAALATAADNEDLNSVEQLLRQCPECLKISTFKDILHDILVLDLSKAVFDVVLHVLGPIELRNAVNIHGLDIDEEVMPAFTDEY